MTTKAKNTARQPEVERQLKEYFSKSPLERPESEADLRLGDFIHYLLDHSPTRQALAREIYRACAKAWDATRDKYGTAHPVERSILKSYHDLLASLAHALEPLPFPELIRRDLEIYSAGADLKTRAAINKALKLGTPRALQNLWATVSTYGTVKKRKRA